MDRVRTGTKVDTDPKKYEGHARFLFNALRFIVATLLLPLSITTSIMSKGEEIVILAMKAVITDSARSNS